MVLPLSVGVLKESCTVFCSEVFTFLPAVCKTSLFPTFSLALVIFYLFDNNHSNWDKMIHGFDLHFPIEY